MSELNIGSSTVPSDIIDQVNAILHKETKPRQETLHGFPLVGCVDYTPEQKQFRQIEIAYALGQQAGRAQELAEISGGAEAMK